MKKSANKATTIVGSEIDEAKAAALLQDFQTTGSQTSLNALGELFMPKLQQLSQLRQQKHRYPNVELDADGYLGVAMTKLTKLINDKSSRPDGFAHLVLSSLPNAFTDHERFVFRRTKVGSDPYKSLGGVAEDDSIIGGGRGDSTREAYEQDESVKYLIETIRSTLLPRHRKAFDTLIDEDPGLSLANIAKKNEMPTSTLMASLSRMRKSIPEPLVREIQRELQCVKSPHGTKCGSV